METLSRRRLTLATADRQWLRRRADRTTPDAVTHLVGLQAQEPLEPYVGLWSRLDGFTTVDLARRLEDRSLVRTLMMRRTLHLHTAGDCLGLRPAHQQMIRARMSSTLRDVLPGVDLDELAEAARPLFDEEPRTAVEVARLLGDRWPDVEPRWLGDALTCVLPLVQIPPRGLWGSGGPARCTTSRAWLGADPAAADEVLDDLVRRYLRAYGPASSTDLRSWCGLTGLPAVLRRLRPTLQTYRAEGGRELLDVPDATLPEEDVALPARFLPAFDNAVLGYDDRTRVVDDAHRGLSVSGARFVLVDGRVAGTWTATAPGFGPAAEVAPAPVTVRVRLLRALTTAEGDEVAEEGTALAALLGDGVPGRAVVSG